MNSGGSFQTASMNRSFCLMLNRSNSMSTKKIAKIFGIIILAAVITAESAAQADELFTQAAALIEEEYAEQPGFTVGEVQHKDDGSYSRSFDLSFGATGIDYTLKVQENSLSISCRKLF